MPKHQSLKNQIRNVRRFLAKRGDSMAPEVKREQEKKLEMLQRKQLASAQNEKERKLAKRYHHVKFFEKKKVLKKIKQLEKRAKAAAASNDGGSSARAGPSADAIQRDLQRHRDNLIYVEFFPKDAKYVSLFAKKDGDTVDNTDKIAKLLVRAKERKNREEQAAALRIENMDRRDYDDDDADGHARSFTNGRASAAKSTGSPKSENQIAHAVDLGVVGNGVQDGAAVGVDDDFFM